MDKHEWTDPEDLLLYRAEPGVIHRPLSREMWNGMMYEVVAREILRLAEELAAEKRQAAEINGWKNDCEGERMRLAEEVHRLKKSWSCAGCYAAGRAEGYNAALVSVRRELLAEFEDMGTIEFRYLRAALNRICPEE